MSDFKNNFESNDKYYYKYIKYKTKYLKLKNKLNGLVLIQDGGAELSKTKLSKTKLAKTKSNKLQILDLTKKNNSQKLFLTNNLQTNLGKIYEKFGNNFLIKSNTVNFNINVILSKEKMPNDLSYYSLYYKEPFRTTHLKPFQIDFFDISKNIINNNSYIANIHKTQTISGSDMVKLCLEINKCLGAEKTYLFDGSSVKCGPDEFDLGFIKLIERKTTFYMNLGFKFAVGLNIEWPYNRYTDETKLLNTINKLINNIRSIKINSIVSEYKKTLTLISKIITDNYSKPIEIKINNSNHTLTDFYYKENPIESVTEIFNESKQVLEVLNYCIKTKKTTLNKYLYKLLTDLFKYDCDKYGILLKYILDNQRYSIKYGNQEIKRHYVIDIAKLKQLRYAYAFVYEF
jgi:hypothetical protein